MSERKKTPQERYAAKYKKQFKIDCITTTEQDIIEKLESVPNKAGYIKQLIRADIAKGKQKNIKNPSMRTIYSSEDFLLYQKLCTNQF